MGHVSVQVGRGEAVGAVWALTGGHHDTTALCARDSEFVRMSRGAFEVLAQQNPRATSNMLEGMARRISAASSARTKRWAFMALLMQRVTCTLVQSLYLNIKQLLAQQKSARHIQCAWGHGLAHLCYSSASKKRWAIYASGLL